MSTVTRQRVVGAVVVTLVVALLIVGALLPGRAVKREAAPRGVMGTSAYLRAVGPVQAAESGVDAAEQALRSVEARMSSWLEDSEIGRLNQATAGEKVALSAETLALLRRARELHEQTQGAFDVTIGPLIELWKQAGRQRRVPSPDAVQEARGASSWDQLVLNEDGAHKQVATLRVDLGGIAKGYGIDRAVEAMEAAGCTGGLVDIGGDVRVFGSPLNRNAWLIGIRDPSDAEGRRTLATIRLQAGSICTSGNYERFSTIDGVRYSHILDPRSGWPAAAAPSVTVIAPTALTADAWATALSVLGKDGLKLLAEHQAVDALVITGKPGAWRYHVTPGFSRYWADRPAGAVREVGGEPSKTTDQETASPGRATGH